MRERVEDLGRLMVMLSNIRQLSAFDFLSSEEVFLEHYLDPEAHQIRMEELFGHLNEALYHIDECLEIARGDDPLNDPV